MLLLSFNYMTKNLRYSLINADMTNKEETNVTYESLLDKVNNEAEDINQYNFQDEGQMDYFDEITVNECNYSENYTKKQLELIADYYGIVKRKKKKQDLIEEIVIFEQEPANIEMTQKRKTLWFYMEEIKNDSFLQKFLILD